MIIYLVIIDKMSNIIVYGVRRTGTSLMVEMIAKNENYKIHNNGENIPKNLFDKLNQSFYEGIFVRGITEDNKEQYSKVKNNVIKFLFSGIFNTDIKYFSSFKKIVVMIRNWIPQNRSIKNLYRIHAINSLESIVKHSSISRLKKHVPNKDEYINDYIYTDGLEYGYYYSYLILDIIHRNYKDKIIIVNFEDLINDINKK